MKVKFSFIRNIVVSLLLITLGIVIGNRHAIEGDIFGVNIPFVKGNSSFGNPEITRLKGDLEDKSVLSKDVDFDEFWKVWAMLEQYYIDSDKLDAQDMVYGAIKGMTDSLEDPYTVYLSPKENQRHNEDLAGSFYGIGVELGYIDQTLAAVSPLKGNPAEKAGVQAGDLILHVKDEKKNIDEDTSDWSLIEAVEKIRGEKGTPVTLTLYRESDGDNNIPFEVTIVRDTILVPSVEVSFVKHNNKRVAHIELSKFGDRTIAEWDKVVTEVLKNKSQIDGIVLDMRNNPGGYLDRSIMIASDFVSKGTIVTQEGRYNSKDYKSTGRGKLSGIPLVILVNRGSASASEIVAGALRDNLGTKLVGEKTFGKGTVQDKIDLDSDSGLHITVARWKLPKGSWIHKEGIEVDVEVEQDYETEQDEVLFKGIEVLNS